MHESNTISRTHKNKTRHNCHLLWQTHRPNEECDSGSGWSVSVCALGSHCPQQVVASTRHFCKAHPGALNLNRGHLQSNWFGPCPVSVRNPVESSSLGQPLVALITWSVCEGPFYCPHAAPCTECSRSWWKSAWLQMAFSTCPPSWGQRSCTWKGSLRQRLPSIYHHILAGLFMKLGFPEALRFGWIFKITRKT